MTYVVVPEGTNFLPGDDRRGAYPDTKAHVAGPPGFFTPPDVFFWPGFDTPLKNEFVSGILCVVPAFDKYTLDNLPDKYKQGPMYDPTTTITAPTDPPTVGGDGRYGSAEGDAPYPTFSLAKDWPAFAAPTRLGSYPFEVSKIKEYCEGNAAALPNPEQIPYFANQGDKGKLYSASPIIRFILAASGLDLTIKSAFRPRLLGREMQDVVFIDAVTGAKIGTNVHHIASSDDAHAIDAFDDHMRFSALDVSGPTGSKKELEGILAYLRQFPQFFTEISVGEEFRSNLVYGTGPQADFFYDKKPWHWQSGRPSIGTLVVGADGRSYSRMEKSPRERSTAVGHEEQPLLWGRASLCCMGDRIHIATTLQVAREAALVILDEKASSGPRLTSSAVPDNAGDSHIAGIKTTPGANNSQAQVKPGVAHPPTITTDIGVAPIFSSSLFGGDGSNGTLGVCRLPRGWLEKEFANGLGAMVRVAGVPGPHESRDRYHFAFHKNAKDVNSYSTGWRSLDAPEDGPTDLGVIGAQRLGQYVYGIAGKNFQGGQRRIEYIERMQGINIRERRSHDGAIYYEGLGSAAAGATTFSFPLGPNSELFVSDHANPHLYFINEFGIGKTTDIDGVPMSYHWLQEDQRGFGSSGTESLPFYPAHRFKYEFWHTYQNFGGNPNIPENTQFPCFAFPWSSGDYDPPEVWFFVPEKTKTGNYTGRLEIYRSLYQEGNYNLERGYKTLSSRWSEIDPRLKINGGTLNIEPGTPVGNTFMIDNVDRNPKKMGFGSWYTKENFVGFVGPFRGVVFGDTRNNGNHTDLTFKVLRDPRKRDTLWLTMAMQSSVFNSGGWDGAWFARSTDDGKTWGRGRQVTPFVTSVPETGWQAGGPAGVHHSMITDAGHILMPGTASFEGQQIQALICINYNGGGVGDTQRQRIVFKEPKVAGG